MNVKTAALVALYLAAIVVANLVTARYGPEASIYNAFLLIGLDLTTRDALHAFWQRHRPAKMGALILAGSALAYTLNRDAAQVAQASAVAFVAAGAVDYGVFAALARLSWVERVNASNIAAAAVDSLVFPTLAFGGLLWGVTFGQFVAKVAGGALWALLLARLRHRPAVEAA